MSHSVSVTLSKLVREKGRKRSYKNTNEIYAHVTSFNDIVQLNCAFIMGDLYQTPYHGGPLMVESMPMKRDLLTVNQKGFVSYDSQPPMETEDIRQKSYLMGYIRSHAWYSVKKYIDKRNASKHNRPMLYYAFYDYNKDCMVTTFVSHNIYFLTYRATFEKYNISVSARTIESKENKNNTVQEVTLKNIRRAVNMQTTAEGRAALQHLLTLDHMTHREKYTYTVTQVKDKDFTSIPAGSQMSLLFKSSIFPQHVLDILRTNDCIDVNLAYNRYGGDSNVANEIAAFFTSSNLQSTKSRSSSRSN